MALDGSRRFTISSSSFSSLLWCRSRSPVPCPVGLLAPSDSESGNCASLELPRKPQRRACSGDSRRGSIREIDVVLSDDATAPKCLGRRPRTISVAYLSPGNHSLSNSQRATTAHCLPPGGPLGYPAPQRADGAGDATGHGHLPTEERMRATTEQRQQQRRTQRKSRDRT